MSLGSNTWDDKIRINRSWVETVAEAIGARHGVLFKDALEIAEQGSAVQITSDAPEVMNVVVESVGNSLINAVEEYTNKHPLIQLSSMHNMRQSYNITTTTTNNNNNNHNKNNSNSNVEELIEKESEWCVRVFVRVAVTGALARYQLENKKIIHVGSTNSNDGIKNETTCNNTTNINQEEYEDGEDDEDDEDENDNDESIEKSKNKINNNSNSPTCKNVKTRQTKKGNTELVPSQEELCHEQEKINEAKLTESIHNTLLTGLLFAFEAFQEVHSFNRDHYPPRSRTGTAGTVGWDTLVLLHFTHHIPVIAREASAKVVDEACGQFVRNWRRLLVALQSIDSHEAPEHSRRRGALSVVNGLIMILFPRYNTHQCNVLLQSVDHAEEVALKSNDYSKSILAPSQHMVSEIITYYYHKGRLHLYESKFHAAHEALQRAYTLLPPMQFGNNSQRRNKLRVRFYFIVAGLCCGYSVPHEIMYGTREHEFGTNDIVKTIFEPLVQSIQDGNPLREEEILEINGVLLRRRGVYLALTHTLQFAYLMHLVRVYNVLSSLPNVDPSRITVKTIKEAFIHNIKRSNSHNEQPPENESITLRDNDKETILTKSSKHFIANKAMRHKSEKRSQETVSDQEKNNNISEEDCSGVNDDKVMQWVIKLIASGYVRGYLSYEHKTLVLSKTNPFPTLTICNK